MKKVTIAGCGPGSRQWLTFAAFQAALRAELLVGPARLLELFSEVTCQKFQLKGNYEEALNVIEKCSENKQVVVLVTGDPGVHSFARLVIKQLGRSNCSVLPGISAVQYAFALLGMPWDDAVILSSHSQSLKNLNSVVSKTPRVAILTGGEEHPAQLASLLSESSIAGKTIYLCEDLSLPTQRVRQLTLEELSRTRASPLNMVLVVDEEGT